MKRVFTILFFLGFCVSLNAQVISWVANTAGVSIALDNNNNVYTVYNEFNPAGDISLTKRNSSGVLQWQVSYDQTDVTKWEQATWTGTDDLGNIIVTGTLMSGFSNPVVAASIVMKFNSSGTLLWRQVFESSFDGSQTKKCLIDESNNIYILGTGINGANGMNLKVKKLSPDGTLLWSYFNALGMPLNFKFTPDNGIVIISRGITGSVNGYAKIDRNGNAIWSLPGVFSQTTGDAAGDAFGNTYIVNLEYIFNPTHTILKKINTSGTEVWSSTYVMAGLRVEVGTDNMPVISGYPSTGSPGSSFVKFNTTGGTVWANMDADSSFSLLAHAQMKIDSQNNIYLAAGTMTEMAICKVNNNGSSGWTVTIPGSGYAYALAIGNDNSIFVVGGNTAGATGRITQMVTSVSNTGNTLSDSYWLENNFPNPFNPSTSIRYAIPSSGFVKLVVFDALGREITTLVNEFQKAGTYETQFSINSITNNQLSSGVYFYKLESNGFADVKSMMLLK